MTSRRTQLAAIVLMLASCTGCGHVGRGLGKVAVGLAVAAAASVVNSAVRGPHRGAAQYGTEEDRAKREAARQADAELRLREAKRAYASAPAAIPPL